AADVDAGLSDVAVRVGVAKARVVEHPAVELDDVDVVVGFLLLLLHEQGIIPEMERPRTMRGRVPVCHGLSRDRMPRLELRFQFSTLKSRVKRDCRRSATAAPQAAP